MIPTEGKVTEPTVASPDWILSTCKTHGFHHQAPFARIASNAAVESLFVAVDPRFGLGKVEINMPATVWANQLGFVDDQLLFGPVFVFPLKTTHESDGLQKSLWPRMLDDAPRLLDFPFQYSEMIGSQK